MPVQLYISTNNRLFGWSSVLNVKGLLAKWITVKKSFESISCTWKIHRDLI